MMPSGTLYAVSDLHVTYSENRELVRRLYPESKQDWLIVAGDVGEVFDDIKQTLTLLRQRFAAVIWAPGNHELWTSSRDPMKARGLERYEALVQMCREIDVFTPEDEYPIWTGRGGPVVVAPLFTLYDYSFRVPDVATKAESLQRAYDEGVVCTDEALLYPDPYPSREQWCWARIEETEQRLKECDPALPTVLINHYPLVREPTRALRYQVFAQWCGTERTADWHTRFRAVSAVYGHLHIPRVTWHDGVRFTEVSLGYPREWMRRGVAPRLLHPVLAGDVR